MLPLSNKTAFTQIAISLICVLFASLRLFSQSSDILVPPINIPTSPEAALLGRFGDIPVSYYTGTSNISIPLYSIKNSAVEIPIILNYNSSGIKVEDEATWVGLGWDLSPGGMIIQEVRGKNDEIDYPNQCEGVPGADIFKNRFSYYENYGFEYQIGRETSGNGQDCGDPFYSEYDDEVGDPYCCVDKVQRGYGQPDIYNYSFGQYSGKFYIVPETHEIRLIDRNEQVYFQKINDNLIEAITLDGTKYQFGAIETANGGINYEYTGKVYKISKIILLNGDNIFFNYSNHTYTELRRSETAFLNSFEGSPPVTSQNIFTYHEIKTLTQIETPEEIINFNLEDREDIDSDNAKRLGSIDIISKISNNKIKSFEFQYEYFPYSTTGVPYDPYIWQHLDNYGKRLKLTELQEIGYDNAGSSDYSNPPYLFEYNTTVTMPMKCSYAKDFWGYYNGANNSCLLPNLDYFDYPYDPDYQVTLVNSTTINPYIFPYEGADRFTDNEKVDAYILKRISYPTRGFTEFEYEPNSFTNQFIPDKSKNIFKTYYIIDNSNLSNSNTIQSFSLSKSTTIHFENKINNGMGQPGITPLTRVEMEGCYIKFYKTKTVNSVVQEEILELWDLSTVTNAAFENDGGKFWLDERKRVDYDSNPTTVYHVEVFFPDALNNPLNYALGVSSLFNYYDDTDVDITVSTQCGLRIKSIKNFTKTGKLVNHKILSYSDGKLLNHFRPLKMYKGSSSDIFYVTDGIIYENISFFKRISVSGNDFGSAGGTQVGYGRVEELELDGESDNWGKKVFFYYNNENKTQQDCPAIPDLKNGKLFQEEVFDNQNVQLQTKKYIYDFIEPFPKYHCQSIVLLSIGERIPCWNFYNYGLPDNTHYYVQNVEYYTASKFGYNIYTIHSFQSYLKEVITENYFDQNIFNTIEHFTYNEEGLLKSKKVFNSNGKTLLSKFYYPTDHIINQEIDDFMISIHNTGTPVLIEEYNGNNLISGKKTIWGNTSNPLLKLPREIYRINSDNTEEKRITLDHYDSRET
ncbi:MAG: hypothetical protein IPH84_10600 [Bacteroidales bacterium]|nr:hypothetical protein [Bacteroidales bacterium]